MAHRYCVSVLSTDYLIKLLQVDNHHKSPSARERLVYFPHLGQLPKVGLHGDRYPPENFYHSSRVRILTRCGHEPDAICAPMHEGAAPDQVYRAAYLLTMGEV